MFSELSLLREDTVWRTPNLVLRRVYVDCGSNPSGKKSAIVDCGRTCRLRQSTIVDCGSLSVAMGREGKDAGKKGMRARCVRKYSLLRLRRASRLRSENRGEIYTCEL